MLILWLNIKEIVSMSDKTFEHSVHIFWEDTDAGGIVYHANYIKFMERARSEILRALNVNQEKLREHGQGMIVAKLEISFKRPAKLDDTLTIKTKVALLKRISSEFIQDVYRGDELITTGRVRVGFVDLATGRPTKMPEEIYSSFLPYLINENN